MLRNSPVNAMPSRYHPALVALHWILAFCVVGLLFAGTLVLDPLANDDPAKLISFRLHMGLGIVTLALMAVRLVLRLSTRTPPRARTGNAFLDRLGPLTHWALYGAVLAMAVSGLLFARDSGLPDAVFGTGPMPERFDHPGRAVHGIVASVLMALIALHVAAALWHQFLRRDGLMARMWFGPR
ncbi:MAG: cytochrome b561 CybB [Rhodobacteraceae bacterium HLUCCA12]|nr:MAG: cytochrome b561 CybB [Rhodobacteraceae bacterium HLUCCA12]